LEVYFIPTFITLYRGKINYFRIFIINALLGWTAIAWVYLLIEAVRSDPASVDIDEITRLANRGIKNATINLKTGTITEMEKEQVDGQQTTKEP
jgi:hypothetical protein